MTTTRAYHLAAADQIDAELRDNRHCDALNPCRHHEVRRMHAVVHRALAAVSS